ncbi:hypothetical protein MTR67_031182 [Solanum verrucosum]|uniref:Tf2-1-like SH3-like domain-containing protein n=1 Tax=Solanum verrucosum TaxID=315347 RepID=A0AAF0U216_SOLVR|nr:hypothetical protein MTR67_031182 [Solanum verrucosum]
MKRCIEDFVVPKLPKSQRRTPKARWGAQFTAQFWKSFQKGLGSKVSPMKGAMRFGKKGKLNPFYIGAYRISKRVGNIAYELELPSQLLVVHPVFHISMLKKCLGNLSLIVPTENIGIKDNLSYEEIPIQILDR